jgi:paraquat-inducible protein B
VDVASALASVERTLASVNAILTSPELKQTIQELPRLMSDLRRTVNTVDREMTGLSRDGREAIVSASAGRRKTLASVQTLAANLDREGDQHAGDSARNVSGASTAPDKATFCSIHAAVR